MSQKSVLIADDETMIRDYFKAVLSTYGLEVVTAGNGEEALKKYDERPFDLVVSDIQMPVMGGVELTRQIRQRSADQPIILITGAAPEDDIQEGTAAGTFFLRKPMSVIEIEQAVEMILNVKRPQPQDEKT